MQTILKLIVLGLGLGSAGVSAAEPADLILVNGKIVTVDDRFSIHQAVAVRGERIVAVGTTQDVKALAGAQTRTIDLAGRTVIPGLIDTHSHVIRASQLWKYEVRFDGVTSHKAALEIVRKRAGELKPGQWVMSLGGWIEDQFVDDARGFTLDELDAAAPDNPVYLDVNYSHRYVNSAFLKAANIPVVNTNVQAAAKPAAPRVITAEAKGLTEDLIERDAQGRATGKITGGSFGNTQAMLSFPVMSKEEALDGLKMIVQESNASGLTAIYDGGGVGVREEAYELARELADQKALDLRVFRTRQMLPRTPEQAAAEADKLKALRPYAGNDYYDLIGIGEIIYTPVHDNFDNAVRLTDDNRKALTALFTAAARDGWNLHLHTVHDISMNSELDLIDELARSYSIKPLRWFFVHADLVDGVILDRMRRHNMSVSLRSNTMLGGAGWQRIYDVVGERAMRTPPLRTVQDSGMAWTFGSEAPRINLLKPLMSLAWAVTGTRFYDGKPVNTSLVTREEALIAHTRNGAAQVFRETSLGQIRPGFYADMVVLDRDYLTVPDAELYSVSPEMTFVGGKLVYRKP